MKAIMHFFWFCSGAHTGTLTKYPAEHNKYVGIGATIFFTALFASLSGGYAMYFVFSGSSFAKLWAVLFGLIWGLAIFNMDRYIVSTIDKNGVWYKQFFQALPRLLLAIMIGIVISRPLELKIFDKEIREQLQVNYLKKQRVKIDTLNNSFASKYQLEIAKTQEMKAQRDSLESAIKEDRKKLNFEIFGSKTEETSGVMGYGPYAKMKEADLRNKETYLEQLRQQLAYQETRLDSLKNFEGIYNEKMLSGSQLDSLTTLAGFADRNEALGQLKQNPDGSTNENMYYAITFISLLFIFFECLPVLVKLMSPTGAYDYASLRRKEIDFHDIDADKDVALSVIDGVKGDRIQSKLDRKRKRLTEA
ncbi:DUF4407 domain-containing protein [Olivibacter sitiensis]|uniref:DUF4407 domain-containing protein n=1 Tax=Olivibacter sitiensis TaxID=376470 RepID=UPI000485595D|nr:DUF4407 domain-containing protein [Olivibacter sitiensis]